MTENPSTAATLPLLSALAREPLERPPVWLMRQAGRYLPEYQEVRSKSGGFLKMCKNPEAAAEVTLQPVRRFGVDAAILFSDILLPLEAMGMELRFEDGRGPVLPRPLSSREDIEGLKPLEPEADLAFVGEALHRVGESLPEGVARIGFCGAPYTLACYALEGGAPGAQARVRHLMNHDPDLFVQWLNILAGAVSSHLSYQVSQGADVVVLFDTWAGELALDDYCRFAQPASALALASTEGVVPRIAFVRGSGHLFESLIDLGTEGLVVDWRVDIGEAFSRYGDRVALQGNLDPAVLLGSPEQVHRRTKELLHAVGGRPGHVLSLGHGVLKETEPDSVAAFVDAARDENHGGM